jgi:hypothetical protein
VIAVVRDACLNRDVEETWMRCIESSVPVITVMREGCRIELYDSEYR